MEGYTPKEVPSFTRVDLMDITPQMLRCLTGAHEPKEHASSGDGCDYEADTINLVVLQGSAQRKERITVRICKHCEALYQW